MDENIELEKRKTLNEFGIFIEDKQCNYSVTIKGLDAILEFFMNEKNHWNNLLNSHSRNVVNSLRTITSFHTARYNELNSIAINLKAYNPSELIQKITPIKIAIEKPTSPKVIYSKSSIGLFLTDIYQKDVSRGEGAYKYFNRQVIDLNQLSEYKGFFDAYLFEKPLILTPSDEIAIHLHSLEIARNEWEQKSQEIKQNFETRKITLEEWEDKTKHDFLSLLETQQHAFTELMGICQKRLSELLESNQKEFDNLGVSYQEKLKLEAPVRYWKTRATNYRKRGWFWVAGLSLIVALAIVLLTFILYDLPEAFHKNLFKAEPEAIKGVIIFATLISFMLYLARVFSRMAFSSFHIERDAEERQQLTYVYLALIKSGEVTEKERDIVLQSLFSRVETGLLKEDGSPTMPTISSFIDQVTQKK